MAKLKKEDIKIIYLNKYTKGKSINEIMERLKDPKIYTPLFKFAMTLDFKTNFDYDLMNNNSNFREVWEVEKWLVWNN